MKQRKPAFNIFIGIFIAAFTIGAVVVYDLVIKDKLDSEEVVVVKPGENIEKSKEITADVLTVERRQRKDLLPGVVLAKDMQSIIGKEASQEILSNSMVSKGMIDEDNIVPNPDKQEAIRPIMENMILAKPGSLRRKDNIDLYVVDKEKIEALKQDGLTNSDGFPKVSSEDKDELAATFKSPILQNVKVVYVKDSSNKEVTDANNDDEKATKKDEKERLNATSSISDLEVILNETDFDLLMNEVINKGNKLYITYN
ncbi:SAF domain-containing protein [Bacillus swezeyi]|uniref:SAF domain-containing protein n=1 Tax=Bacillus swezeyi TaxID=1925020 RepID=A0A5M8RLW2_9BACI|nr:SAF domain-containing protein [Bacillus swezeyi]KAA6446912.1 hypothetical protein DX927_22940 [Bacillus swezeyi]KAA6471480.1 hypothetical protein DX928_23180 [Bacillus swezeyi]